MKPIDLTPDDRWPGEPIPLVAGGQGRSDAEADTLAKVTAALVAITLSALVIAMVACLERRGLIVVLAVVILILAVAVAILLSGPEKPNEKVTREPVDFTG